MHRLVIAPSAEADLNAIVDYIAFTLNNPEAPFRRDVIPALRSAAKEEP